MTKLTVEDLNRALEDERRQGTYGYSARDNIEGRARLKARGDRLAVREMNAKGWTYEQMLAWVDSKCGRWFWDSLYGCNDPAGAARLVDLDWITPEEMAAYEVFTDEYREAAIR